MKKGQILNESILCLFGKISWGDLWVFVFTLGIGEMVITGDIFMTAENLFFYVPENMILFVLALCIGGIIGGIGWACMMKDDSAGKDSPWASKYIASMIVTIIIAPLVTNVLLSAIVQEYYPDMIDVTYCFLLILATFAIARFVLLTFNKGLKKMFGQLKSDIGDVKDGISEIKGSVSESTDTSVVLATVTNEFKE